MNALSILKLNTTDTAFDAQLNQRLAWQDQDDLEVHQSVLDIIKNVRQLGDQAVIDYTRQFDQRDCTTMAELEIPQHELQQAWDGLSLEHKTALQTAAERIKSYAEHQSLSSWEFTDELGNRLGQKITPLDRVGLYVPGGKAAYPSSVLMNALPAKVAGVHELIMTVPMPGNQSNSLVLAAAHLAGVDKVFSIGGAQAIAALANGTETIPPVEKIVGPGNIYVATAKKLVFGQVGIDMIAGPSEILIICDGQTNPEWVAMDLFSQAEHDENAQAILLSDQPDFLDQVEQAMQRLIIDMPRKEVIAKSITSRGAMILVKDMDEAAQVANHIAPEHLELSVADPDALSAKIRNAGAIFMGRHTAEALGDYCAGPNHVLPTSGTARFSSPLGVYDFQKRSSIIQCTANGASKLAETASVLAKAEGLTAHAKSAEFRMN